MAANIIDIGIIIISTIIMYRAITNIAHTTIDTEVTIIISQEDIVVHGINITI